MRRDDLAESFARKVITWQKQHGRHDLPWQESAEVYRVWLSEVMLQQTQVTTAAPYFRRFVQRFPDVKSLAHASLDEVLTYWQGLGYYARGRNLHRAAQTVVVELGGEFPTSAKKLMELPGIGRTTAAAIAVFAYGERAAILDGNVRRVLCRHFAIATTPGNKTGEKRLWKLAEDLLPSGDIESYTQGLMDLGATICSRINPKCTKCPVQGSCVAQLKGLTKQIPLRAKKKQREVRRMTLAVIVCASKALLIRRPDKGIWGGLWSVPEYVEAVDTKAEVERQWGVKVKLAGFLNSLEHEFTHFTLRALPTLYVARSAALRFPEGARWVAPQEMSNFALPAPIARLFRELQGHSLFDD